MYLHNGLWQAGIQRFLAVESFFKNPLCQVCIKISFEKGVRGDLEEVSDEHWCMVASARSELIRFIIWRRPYEIPLSLYYS